MGVEGRIKMPTKKKSKLPKILWHYGSCDHCGKGETFICHFGYDTQKEQNYRICIKCLLGNLENIMYGWIPHKKIK